MHILFVCVCVAVVGTICFGNFFNILNVEYRGKMITPLVPT